MVMLLDTIITHFIKELSHVVIRYLVAAASSHRVFTGTGVKPPNSFVGSTSKSMTGNVRPASVIVGDIAFIVEYIESGHILKAQEGFKV